MIQLSDLSPITSPLPWHAREWEKLSAQLRDEQLPHALLLAGGQYTGKSELALALSRLLLCSQAEGALNCGQCHSCDLTAAGSHGDFRWLQPEEKSRVIKIDQIREMIRFSSKTAGFGLRKVIVLAPADSMNVNAFNALLKSLEEPATDTYIILICNRMDAVPATIRSRCQILRLPVPNIEACLKWLDDTTGDRGESSKLLSFAEGRPLLAQQLFYSGGAEAFAARHFGLQALLAGSISVPEGVALWADSDTATFLDEVALGLQRVLGSLSTKQLRSRQGRAAFCLSDEVTQLQRAVSAGANPNKQLVMDALLSKLARELGAGTLGDTIPTHKGAGDL